MKILFVCLGNICRSPMAEGIMQHKINLAGLSAKVQVDSAGFEPFHTGDSPDPRAINVTRKYGVSLSHITARLFRQQDFEEFDHIYVMDHNNYRDVILQARNKNDQHKVDYLMNLLEPGKNQKVPDPWYGDMRDFEAVYSLIDKATDVILAKLKQP